jgi:hypothetical protein
LKARRFAPGDRVRLTGEFLRNTGQIAGGEGQSRWTVLAHDGCRLCSDGQFVQVDQRSEDDPERWRHIHAGNLERAR